MSADAAALQTLAQLVGLAIDDEEMVPLQAELAEFIGYFERMEHADVDAVPLETTNRLGYAQLREDRPAPERDEIVDELLAAAAETDERSILIPNVL